MIHKNIFYICMYNWKNTKNNSLKRIKQESIMSVSLIDNLRCLDTKLLTVLSITIKIDDYQTNYVAL